MKIVMKISVFMVLIVCVHVINGNSALLKTTLGIIQGTILLSDNGNKFEAFRGIPYAKPPIGPLRFMPPEKPDLWNGTLDATKDGNDCLQVNEFALASNTSVVLGDEDCLYINVYKPLKNDEKIFPVMVFIYGGGYMSGTGSSYFYGPHRFMDKDVILVTFNYRLGPFGFLSSNDEVAPGNYGLLDQVLALKWVQQNIADFRGNPDMVTIFGESAGAASVTLHMLSPLSKGLFHAAILQSGNVLSDWGFEYRNPVNLTLKLANDLQCTTTDMKMMLECLQKIPAMHLLTNSTPVPGINKEIKPMFIFRPTVDRARGSNAFLPNPPEQQLLKGVLNLVPTISGTTQDEGLMFALGHAMKFGGLHTANKEMLPKFFSFVAPGLMHASERGKNAIEMTKNRYLNHIDESNLAERIIALNRIFGSDIDYSTDRLNQLLTKRGITLYAYKLTYRGNHSWIDMNPGPQSFITKLQMVVHGDDLQYLFRCKLFRDSDLIGDDRQMAETMLSLWTNFAKFKIPFFDDAENNDDDNRCQINYRWNAYDLKNPRYLDLNLKSKLVSGFISDNYTFWSNIYDRCN